MEAYGMERQGKGRKVEDCKETCGEHSGMVERDFNMATWIKSVFAMVSAACTLMAYSVFWQAPKIDTAVAEMRLEINNIRSEFKAADQAIDKRITCLEEVVYRGKK